MNKSRSELLTREMFICHVTGVEHRKTLSPHEEWNLVVPRIYLKERGTQCTGVRFNVKV